MMPMRLEKLRQADLNLLITFVAIAEEKSITAAASRLFLSQPAVSRALQRARAMFQDDLLVRSPNGFELTLRGRKILDELEGLLPRMENLVAPALFDPTREKSHFRISGPDNVCTVVLPPLCRQYANGRYQVHFEFWPWRSGIAELVEHGQLDLVLHIDDGLLPSHFQSERLSRRIGFAPWRARATLATGCHLSNTWPRATSWLPPLRGCKQFQTSNLRLSVQNAALVFGCLTSAWPCNAFPAPNWSLP
jgi:DNA-binding transcriptional LysR family regulator